MRNMKRRVALILVWASIVGVASAQRQRKFDFKETTLKNGLRVITVEDHGAPVVALAITYNVGSRDERKGRTGFAHLFEHMMFQGSENVGKGEHFYQVLNNGGQMNGTTNEDRTNYFEIMPANQLDLVLFLEADRMRSLAITPENLTNQRNTVQEERRESLDNRPYGKANELMQELLYDNFAYKHTTIGSMADLNAATLDDVRDFFKLYYAPNNAVLTLVGDFKTDDALNRIKRAFESIPRQPDPPAVDMSEPAQKAERRATVDDSLARVPRVDIGFKAVPGNSPDFYALRLLASMLGGSPSSRLFQKLVKEKEVVIGAISSVTSPRGLGYLYISATLKAGKKVDEVEAAIYEELERLKTELASESELNKAKSLQRSIFTNTTQSSLGVAILLGEMTVNFSDPGLINTRLDRYEAITAEDVRRVANKYLTPHNRTVVISVPKPKNLKSVPAEGVKGVSQ